MEILIDLRYGSGEMGRDVCGGIQQGIRQKCYAIFCVKEQLLIDEAYHPVTLTAIGRLIPQSVTAPWHRNVWRKTWVHWA